MSELTFDERSLLVMVCNGYCNKEIAGQFGIPVPTAASRVLRLLKKLGAKTRAEAVHRAYLAGLLKVPLRPATPPPAAVIAERRRVLLGKEG